jgi:hypothetical protein
LFEKLDLNCNSDNITKCPEKSGVVYGYIFLMIYVVVGNVLLINLLIAMFSSTFAKVQENSDVIWKSNRYKLVYGYVNVPLLPRPLSLISFFIDLVKCLCIGYKSERTVTLSVDGKTRIEYFS